MGSSTGKNRKVYFEFMRIIACALVLFSHLPGYHLFEETEGAAQFFYMCMTMITRMSIPMFLMISGALLLGREDEWTKVFKKRFLRIVVLLLATEFILMILNTLHSIKHGLEYDFSFGRFVHGFMENSIENADPYWYLYCYLGILFMLPFLQRVAKGFTKTEMTALFALHFIVSSVLPLINVFMRWMDRPVFSFSGSFSVPFALENAFFFVLLGYYLENRIDIEKVKGRHLLGLTAAALTGLVLENMCTYMDAAMNGEYSQKYVQMFDYMLGIAIYMLIKYLFVKVAPGLGEGRSAARICFVGSLTLGIYLFDPCLRVLMFGTFQRLTGDVLPVFPVSLGWVVVSMLLGGFITFVLKKIPGIKRFI